MDTLNDVVIPWSTTEYLIVAAIGVCYFFVQHFVSHFMIKIYYPGYMKLS